LNIALDATYSIGRSLSGVGVYSREILFGLARAHPEARFLFCYRAHRLLRSFSDSLPANGARTLLCSGGFWPQSAPLFHGLNQRVDSVRAKRIVATFHDLFVLTGDYSPEDFRVRFAAQAQQAAERSDLIVAVSEFTANQVVDILGVGRSRIRVIHHGVNRPVFAPPPDAQRENLILHVGAIQHRKNIIRLVEAFERTPPGWRLMLVGSQGYGAEEILARIERSPRRAAIVLPGYVGAGQLGQYYAKARVFAFPSLDEGFGMPILDAMARGVPVLTSNRSATREVAGSAALLIDPAEPESVTSGLLKIVSSPVLRDQLRQAGLAHVAGFSWDTAVEKTWGVYEELLAGT
jgi:glycosyltransferase involved in cell wall biosynthesis